MPKEDRNKLEIANGSTIKTFQNSLPSNIKKKDLAL